MISILSAIKQRYPTMTPVEKDWQMLFSRIPEKSSTKRLLTLPLEPEHLQEAWRILLSVWAFAVSLI